MNTSVHHILKHFCCLCTKSYATCQGLFITLHNVVSLLWNQHVHMGVLSLLESTWPLTYRVFLHLNMIKVSIIKTVGWLCIAYLIFDPVNPWICVLCMQELCWTLEWWGWLCLHEEEQWSDEHSAVHQSDVPQIPPADLWTDRKNHINGIIHHLCVS